MTDTVHRTGLMKHGTGQTDTKRKKEGLMKNRIKIFALTVLTVLLVFASVSFNPIRAEAGLKDGNYYFSSCAVTKFQIKNNAMILRTEKKAGSEITRNGDNDYKSYKIKTGVSKNCKYILKYFDRRTGKADSDKSNYSEIKDIIDFDRSWYIETGSANNVVESYIKVKNGRVVKIVYCAM